MQPAPRINMSGYDELFTRIYNGEKKIDFSSY